MATIRISNENKNALIALLEGDEIMDDVITRLLNNNSFQEDLTPIQSLPEPMKEVHIIYDSDADLLAKYFQDHPEKNMDNYSDAQLSAMGKMLRGVI